MSTHTHIIAQSSLELSKARESVNSLITSCKSNHPVVDYQPAVGEHTEYKDVANHLSIILLPSSSQQPNPSKIDTHLFPNNTAIWPTMTRLANSAFLSLLFAFVISGNTAYAQRCQGDTEFLGMSDADLFNAATGRNRVNGCFIYISPTLYACDMYVKAATVGAGEYRGWPRTIDQRGTGCVRAPRMPKRIHHCYYADSNYDLTPFEVASFCTDDGKKNAVAQIKHAIVNGQCNQCGVLSV